MNLINHPMKKKKITPGSLFTVALLVLFLQSFTNQQPKEPWTEKQLLQPADLAKTLNDPRSKKPILLSIGFGGGIKGSKDLGAARDKEGIDNLKKEVSALPKNADIVIYCGCCPFKDCPNVRPAFKLLNEMKFTNHKLLNLSHNLKVDWIEKGYPSDK